MSNIYCFSANKNVSKLAVKIVEQSMEFIQQSMYGICSKLTVMTLQQYARQNIREWVR